MCIALFSLCFIARVDAARFDKDSLLSAAGEGRNEYLRISALLELSDHYSSFFKDSSILYARQALELSRQYKNIRGEANALYAYATIYINSGRLAKARETYLEGLKLCDQNNETDGKIEGLVHFSVFYQMLGKNDSMMYYSLKALDLSKKTNNIEIQAGVAHDIGNLYA